MPARLQAKRLGTDIHRVYLVIAIWTLLIWMCYPICWGVSEGGNVIAPDSEAVFYGILDLCAKPFFSIAMIYGHWKIDPERLGVGFRDHEDEGMVGGSKAESQGSSGPVTAEHGHGHGHRHRHGGRGECNNTTQAASMTAAGNDHGHSPRAARENTPLE